ncbi:LysR family transcriptional regulator [Facklamia sp. DSM 111018]|uniref:LysR family transcriptional regulator n=1 Tax=Facklamia lactis TaxID=2749967 RepID=A0ABS0LQ64_9LACT|nr:LysR family transcriptional regulator [Facklamia lactis]MBG9980514.1 LysR family transcriptional regulator [Facklamia lactis]MBG9986306.1 LysR family transcriptional regulator [Facklamia lactis]
MFQGMEYVMAVYQEQSFSKAAAKLYISQPSLSANIKRIEKRLGHDIFDRSTIPLRVTEFGEEYIRNVREIERIELDFKHFLFQYDNLQYGKIIVGGTSLFASMILPKLMAKYSEKYPAIQLELLEATTNKLISLLHEGEIDLMLDNTYLDEVIFDRQNYTTESLMLAVPKSFEVNEVLDSFQVQVNVKDKIKEAVTEVEPVKLKDFTDLPFVLLHETNDTGVRARYICQQQSFQPNVAYTVEQQLTAYNIALSGMAICFIGDTLLVNVPYNEELVFYRLEGEHVTREVNIYWKKDRYQSKASQAFLEMIREEK